MKLNFNVENRKDFVRAISEITGEQAVYKFTPTYSYTIGTLTVNRDGTLSVDDEDPRTEIIISELEKKGFHMEMSPVTNTPALPEPAQEPENTSLTISVPIDKANPDLLRAIIDSKKHLIMKALDASTTDIRTTDTKLEFPWFNREVSPDEVKAYAHFIEKLCALSMELKRVNAKEHPVENEKYTFRTFLLRLGFIGAEYKTERKLLMKNLDGNSAFRHPAKEDA